MGSNIASIGSMIDSFGPVSNSVTPENKLLIENEEYNIELPENEAYETLGGLIVHHTETIPEKDEISPEEKEEKFTPMLLKSVL